MADTPANSKLTRALGIAGMVIGLSGAVWAASTTVGSAGDIRRLTGQMDRVVIVLDNMRTVDASLATEIAAVRGSSTTEIALINQRISQMIDMLVELKAERVGR